MKKKTSRIDHSFDAHEDTHCVQSMYLRPSGDLTIPFDKSATLVLETDLNINPGHECSDIRLGDLLVDLDTIVQMARTDHKDVDCVEIMCVPRKDRPLQKSSQA